MQWHDGHSVSLNEEQSNSKHPPFRWKQNPDYAVGYDDHRNGSSIVGIEDMGGMNGVDPYDRINDHGHALGVERGGLGTVGGDDDSLSEEKQHSDLEERGALMAARNFGPQLRPQNATEHKAFKDTIVACNSLAMSALRRGNTERCRDLLTRALEVANAQKLHERKSIGDINERSGRDEDCGGDSHSDGSRRGIISALQILTLNNTACLHRRLEEPRHALRCLRQAAELGRRSCGSEHLEVTHLNACAVLSELGRHEEALEHARSAVYYGQELEGAETQAGGAEASGRGGQKGHVGRSRRARLATLAISYYNLAVELEYTHRYEACLRWYDEAVKLARDPDVHNEELIRTFQRSFAGARKKHSPQQPRRLMSVRRAPARVESIPIGKSVRDMKHPSDGYSPLSFGVLDTLGNGLPPNRFDGGDAAGSPVSNGSGGGRRMDHEFEYRNDGRVRHRHRRAKWPFFDGVKTQRASDERRSQARGSAKRGDDRNAGFRADGGAARSENMHKQDHEDNSTPFPDENCRRDHVVQHHQYSKNTRQDVARNGHYRGTGKTSRIRPASGSAAVRAGGGGHDVGCGGESMRQTLSRKRPASADIVRERDRGSARRMHYDQVSSIHEVTGEPSAVELTREQQRQHQRRPQCQRLPGKTGLAEATINNLRPMSGMGTVAAAIEGGRQQWQPPASCRRPKSAYPRLQEGTGRSGNLIIQRDGYKHDGTSSSRVGRIRSLSARALNGPARSSVNPPRDIQRSAGCNDREHHRPRAEDAEGEHPTVVREQEGAGGVADKGEEAARDTIPTVELASTKLSVLQGPTGVRLMAMTTDTSSASRRTKKGVEGKGCAGSSKAQTNRLAYSASAAEINPRRRKKPSTTADAETRQETSPDPQTGPPAQAVQAAVGVTERVRKATHSRRVPTRSSPPRNTEDSRSREGGRRRGKTNPGNRSTLTHDNGRDGKFYLLDSHLDGQQPSKSSRPSTSLVDGVECDESPCLDNGREGKLYVELDNGRDGKLYLEVENDDLQRCEPSVSAPSTWEPVVRAPGYLKEGMESSRKYTSEKVEGNVTAMVDSIKGRRKAGGERHSGVETPPERRSEAANIIQRSIITAALRRRSSAKGGGDGGRDTRRTLPELFSFDRATSDCEALTERGHDHAPRRHEPLVDTDGDVAVPVHEVGVSTPVDKERRRRARKAIDRHVLAASTIRSWIARASLVRRLHRSRGSRDDLKRRWEPEVHRIAATRIQALARGAARRRERWKAEKAAVEIQRVERGWQTRSVMKELAQTRLEERRVAREKIQRLLDRHQGRLEASRSRQIAWEESAARQGAASMLQSAWRCSQSRHQPLLERQQQRDHDQSEGENATATAESKELGSTAPTADAGQSYQRWQSAQTSDVIYSLWSAVTSLVTTAATRHAVRTAVGQSLLAPAAETLAAFNRECAGGSADTTGGLSVTSSTSLSSGLSKHLTTEGPPDPASFECALKLTRDISSATRRMAGAVRTRSSSLSVVQAAAERLMAGASGDGDGARDGGSGEGNGVGRGRAASATETAEAQVVSIVFEVAQEFWTFLSCSKTSRLLAELDDRAISEKLTEMLSCTLQSFIDNLERIIPLRTAPHSAFKDGKGQQQQPNATNGGDDHHGHFIGGLPQDWKRLHALHVEFVQALASSGTTVLLSHPDINELITGRIEDGEKLGGCRGSLASQHRDGEMGGCDGKRGNDDDYARLVAEACWSCSFATKSGRGDGSSCRGGSGNKVVDRLGHDRQTKTAEDGQNICVELQVEPHDHQDQCQQRRPPALVQELLDERVQFLLSVTELVDCAAEEIVRGMGVPVPPNPACYDDTIRQMSKSLWILAEGKSRDLEGKGQREELRKMTDAAVVVQRWFTQHQIRHPRFVLEGWVPPS